MTPGVERRNCTWLLYDGPGAVRRCARPATFLVDGHFAVCGHHIGAMLRLVTEEGETARVESA